MTNPSPAPRHPPHRLSGFDYASPDAAYFVTLCAHQGTPFIDASLAQEVVTSLHWLRQHRGVRLYAYCLMLDHLHLLLQLQDGSKPLGLVLSAFKTWTTRQSWTRDYRGTLWQGRFYDHVVRRSEAGAHIAAYIRENPVRKGLVTDAADDPWSGTPDPL